MKKKSIIFIIIFIILLISISLLVLNLYKNINTNESNNNKAEQNEKLETNDSNRYESDEIEVEFVDEEVSIEANPKINKDSSEEITESNYSEDDYKPSGEISEIDKVDPDETPVVAD